VVAIVNTLVVSSIKCFHLSLLTKLEPWLKGDQHQKDLIVEQPLLLVDEIKLKKVKKPKGIVWPKLPRLQRKSFFVS
jgi:hypothetical protein